MTRTGDKKKKRDSDDAAIWSHTTSIKQTYRIANFLGRRVKTGIRVKHTTKRAIAARFRAPKTSKRSQRLTGMFKSAVLTNQSRIAQETQELWHGHLVSQTEPPLARVGVDWVGAM